MSVSPVSSPGVALGSPAIAGKSAVGESSDNLFSKLIQDADNQQQAADEQFQKLVNGESEGLHQVVLSAAKADLSFRLVLELRNKLMESYQEIMRMQV